MALATLKPIDYALCTVGVPKQLAMETHDGVVTVVFPTASVAARWSSIGLTFFLGATNLLTLGFWLWLATRWPTPAMPHRSALVPPLSSLVIWWSVAGVNMYRLVRFGPVGRKLVGTPDGLWITTPGWFKPRERFVAAKEIASISSRRLRWDLTPRRNMRLLEVQRRDAHTLLFRLFSRRHAELPDTIALALREVLDRPAVRVND